MKTPRASDHAGDLRDVELREHRLTLEADVEHPFTGALLLQFRELQAHRVPAFFAIILPPFAAGDDSQGNTDRLRKERGFCLAAFLGIGERALQVLHHFRNTSPGTDSLPWKSLYSPAPMMREHAPERLFLSCGRVGRHYQPLS